MKILTAGRMPVPTWRWLGVNDINFSLPAADFFPAQVAFENAQGLFSVGEMPSGFPPPETFFNTAENPVAYFSAREADLFWQVSQTKVFAAIPANFQSEIPAKLTFSPGENGVLAEDIWIFAGKNSNSRLLLDISAAGKFTHVGRMQIFVDEGAVLEIAYGQTAGASSAHFTIAGGMVANRGHLHMIWAETGGIRTVSACNIVLAGAESKADLNVLYTGRKRQSLDFSLRMEHRGKNSVSNIKGLGVLAGESRKIFRDTLDFVSGASGSKGREEENVLMLSRQAQNLSVPVLLCGEDDVEGEHAASAGRPDEEALFYLMSRGLSYGDALQLVAAGAIAAITSKIPDAAIRKRILRATTDAAKDAFNQISP